jgi:hypothetical protein
MIDIDHLSAMLSQVRLTMLISGFAAVGVLIMAWGDVDQQYGVWPMWDWPVCGC